MIKIYHTQDAVWWNTGNEIKPNLEAFHRLVFVEATNFNISWLSETTINVIVPSTKTTTMIKIQQDNQQPQYFYLLEIVNRTKTTMECVFELDVWCTYLLTNFPQGIKTIRTLNVNTVSSTINIEPVGVPTGRIRTTLQKFNNTTPSETLLRIYKTDKPYDTMQAYPGLTTNIYYVFKTRTPLNEADLTYVYKKENHIPELPNYVLIPLLNLSDYGITKSYKCYYYDAQQNPPDYHYSLDTEAIILNNKKNIEVLVNNYNDYQKQGVGEFIGVWLGPNYFRLKDKGVKVGMYDFGTAWNRGLIGGDLPKCLTQDILLDFKSSSNDMRNWVKYEHIGGQGTFLAIRMTAMPLEMVPLNENFDKTKLLEGYRFQDNQDNHIIINADKVFFNQTFNYSNGVETTAININIPYGYDSYYTTLAAQKNTMNTSLALSGANAMIQGLASSTGLIPPKPSTGSATYKESSVKDYQAPGYIASSDKVRKTAKGKRGGTINNGWTTTNTMVRPALQKLKTSNTKTVSRTSTPGFGIGNILSAGFGIANAGMQFISTLAEQTAYRTDLRTQLSNTVLNVNDKYVNWHLLAYNIQSLGNVDGVDINTIIDALSYEFLYGPEVETGISYKFYGVESQPTTITTFDDRAEYYIQIDENTALSLQNQWGDKYSPTIKEAMLSLLTNGIRITGDVIR